MIRLATPDDIAALVALERRHGRDELSSDDPGLEAQLFDKKAFTELIARELLLLSLHGGAIVGYGVVTSEGFYQGSAFYRRLYSRAQSAAKELDIRLQRPGCYGPVWVAPAFRGKGVFTPLVNEILTQAKKRFDGLVTFIAEENEHSLNVHVQRAQMQVADFFDDNGRGFYLLLKPL